MKTQKHLNVEAAFEPGDVISFCDENFYVIENYGSQGVVCPFGETFYIRMFRWKFGSDYCTFVRKATKKELSRLGLDGKL